MKKDSFFNKISPLNKYGPLHSNIGIKHFIPFFYQLTFIHN